MSLQFRTVEIVCAVARLGNFSKAAEELYISQPALSQYIQRAESELGYPLFVREKGNCIPTQAGKILAQRGIFLLQYRDDLLRDMAIAANMPSGVVRFGMANGYTQRYFSETIQGILQYDSQIHLVPVENYTNRLVSMMHRHEVDIILAPVPPEIPGTCQRPLRRETLLLAVPDGHPANKLAVHQNGEMYIDLAQAAKYPFVMVKDAPRFTDFCEFFFKEAGVSPMVIFQPDNWTACDLMVAAGVGLSLLPVVTAECSKSNNHYYRIKTRYPDYRILTISYLKDRPLTDTMKRVVTQLERMFGDDLVGKKLEELDYPLSIYGG
ncbi:MAG: LysR family transcriptional regulator [Clostridiales bacterium]|nr:LysR family transcriptional regulator [Clostridiales bacterium]